MKIPHLLLALSIALVATAIAVDPAAPPAAADPAPAAPAGKRKGKGKAQRPGLVIRAIDADHDHKLDAKEVEELKKQFGANPKGPLVRFDMNANGTLDTDEITTINERMAKQAERKANRPRGAGKRKKQI